MSRQSRIAEIFHHFLTSCVLASSSWRSLAPPARTHEKKATIEEKPHGVFTKERKRRKEKTMKINSRLCVANLWFVCLIFLLPVFVAVSFNEKWWKLFSHFHSTILISLSKCFPSSRSNDGSPWLSKDDEMKLTELARLPHSGYHSMTESLSLSRLPLHCENRKILIFEKYFSFSSLFLM